MSTSQKNRLRMSKLTMQFWRERNAKLMIFRNDRSDTPHLLISWENFSKEIDVHLKSRSAGGEEHPCYLAKIHENDFVKLFSSFEPIFVQSIIGNLHKLRRVRPGWLGHRGYAVFYMDKHEKSQAIDRIAPLQKYRGKKYERVFDIQAFGEWIKSPEAVNYIYHPSILHEVAAEGCDDVVMAGRIRGNHKPKFMTLHLVKMSGGKSIWVRLDKLSQGIMEVSKEFTLSCLKLLLPNDAWTTIYTNLHLEELGIELA